MVVTANISLFLNLTAIFFRIHSPIQDAVMIEPTTIAIQSCTRCDDLKKTTCFLFMVLAHLEAQF